MKSWHIVIIVLIAYTVGALYPSPYAWVKSKVGM